MTPKEEKAYELGAQAAWRQMLSTALANLPGEMGDPSRMLAARTAELHDVRVSLRRLCAEFGANDWPDDLHLGDVIEKYLAPALEESAKTTVECRAIAEERARGYARREHGDAVNGHAADRLCAIFREPIAGACARCRGTGEAFTEGAERPFSVVS